jgi:hypothetical protein
MQDVFEALRDILKKHTGKMKVKDDTASSYSVDAGYSETWKKDVWFGGVRRGKSYVSYHLMAVYTCPDLVKGLTPELRKRMQGKACFNFKTLSPAQAKEIDRLTRDSVREFLEQGRIRVGRPS